jgi:hypothetical protein
MDPMEMWCENADWIQLTQDRVQRQAVQFLQKGEISGQFARHHTSKRYPTTESLV